MTKKRGFLGFFACLFVAIFFATGAFAASDIYLDCPVPDENSVAVGFWNNVAEPNFGGEPLGFSGSANNAISVGFEPYVINPHRVTTSVETGITDGVGNCVAVIWYMSDHGMFYRFVQYSENAELYDHAPTLEPYSKIPFGWITTVPGYYLELPIYQEFLQESNETKAKIFAAIPYQSYNSQDAKYYPFRTNTLCTQGSYCASNNTDLWDWNGYATGEGTSVKGIEQCDGGWPSAPGATQCDETGNYIQFDCVDNQNGSGRTGANADFVNGYSFSRMVDDNVHMVCQAGGWNNEGGDFGNPDGLQCILINPDTKEIIDAKGQGFCSIDRSGDDGNHYVMTWTGDANLYVKCRLATEEEDLSDGSKLHVGDIRCEYFDANNSESKLYKSYNISYDLNGGTANNPVNPKREISAVISRDATKWTVYYEPIGDQECYEPFSYDGDLNKCVAGHGGEYDLCNGANAKCDPFIPLLGPEEDGNKQLTFRCWHNMADTNNPESCLYDNLDVGSDAARGDEQYPFLEKVFGTSGYINVRALYDQYSWLCEAGTYYKGGDAVDTCTTCPAGSVCPEDTLCSTGAESIGISSCGGGYTSEAGATSCHPATYKVTLDKQGGTGGTDAYWYKYNSSETCYYFADAGLTKCIDDSNGQNITIPTRAGYTFDGYWTGKDGTGTMYVDATGLTKNNLYKTTGDRTLYAKWQPNTIKVTLDSDGATSAGTTAYWYQYNTNNKCYYYSDAALTTCMGGTTTHQKINTLPSKNGYAFGGYYTGKNGTGKQYITAAGYMATGSIVDSVSSNITLYAKWNLETYTITYDANGGTMPSSGVVTQYTVETDSFALPRPTHAKATFAGWRSNLGGAVIADDVIKKGSYGDLKLTARYTVDCEPGKYFNKETKSCTECASGGWYCEGGSFDYSLDQDQGLRVCPEPDSSFMDKRVTVVDDGENITGGPELVNQWMRKNWGVPEFEIEDQTVEDSRYGLSSIDQCQYALLYNVSMPKWKKDHGTTAKPRLFEIWQYDSNNHEYTAVVQSGWLSTIPGYYLKNPIKGSCTEEGFIKPRYGKQPYADMDICPAGSYCPGNEGKDEVYEAECGSPDDSDILTEFNRVTCPKGGTLEGLTAEDQCDGSFNYRICFYDLEHADGGIGGIAGFNPEKCTNKIIEKCDSCTDTATQISGVCVVDSNKDDYAFDDDGNTYTICLIHDENNPNGVPGYRYNCDIDTQQVVNGPRCQYDLIYYTLTYNANGGSIPDLADVPTKWNVNDPLPTTPNATRDGYKFLGWLTENDQTLDAGTEWAPNEYLGDNADAQVISLTAQWEELITCLPGRYLPAGETQCKICPAGYGCPTENVTYSQNKTQDQGMTQCTATTYSDGTTGFCTKCANGSTSTTDGATACTPCPAGQTGSGTGTCGYYCSNKDETVASWKTPTWVTGNIVNDDCVIASCTELYELQSDGKKCIGRVFKATLDNDGATTAGTAAFWYRYKTSSVMYADADLSTPLGGVKYKITVPAKTNYVFGGYYTQKAGAGTQVVDAEGEIAKHTANTFGADTTLYAKWTPVTVDCAAGQYLPAAKTACASCPAGYRCPNATTYSFSETTDQGATKCNKGTFSTGGAKSCTTCAEGSYNTDGGATNCTACPLGKTTVGNVRSACDGVCPNADLTTAWKKPHYWNFNNTVPTLCKSAACAAGAVLANEGCYHLVRVTLDTQGGTAGIPAFYYAYQNYNDGGYYKDEKLTTEIAPADYMPTRTGYEFGGYYTEKNGAGDQIIMDIGDFMDEQMYKEWGPDSFTIYAAWTAKQIACAAGQYLPAGAEECKPCAAGNSCAGGTFTFSTTVDQGLTPCAAGSFSAAGAKTCTACDTGSYTNAAGATACVPCQDGKTTSGTGRTSCDASCDMEHVAGWATAEWFSDNTTSACVPEACNDGYFISPDTLECAENSFVANFDIGNGEWELLGGGQPDKYIANLKYGEMVPDLWMDTMPKLDGYLFMGFFTEPNGQGEMYWNSVGRGVHEWEITEPEAAFHAYYERTDDKDTLYYICTEYDENGEINKDACSTYQVTSCECENQNPYDSSAQLGNCNKYDETTVDFGDMRGSNQNVCVILDNDQGTVLRENLKWTCIPDEANKHVYCYYVPREYTIIFDTEAGSAEEATVGDSGAPIMYVKWTYGSSPITIPSARKPAEDLYVDRWKLADTYDLAPGDEFDPSGYMEYATKFVFKFTPLSWASKMIACDAGTYLPAGADQCEVCEPWKYCPGGTYDRGASNDAGAESCPAVDSAHLMSPDDISEMYSPNVGALDIAENITPAGSKAITDCRVVATYWDEEAFHHLMEIRTYNADTGKYSDRVAGGWYATSGTGVYMSGFNSCALVAGASEISNGNWALYTNLVDCPAGSYCPAASGGKCSASTPAPSTVGITQCPAGTYNGGTMANNVSQCLVCTDGKTSVAGAASCNIACTNATGAGTWKTPTLSNGTVSGLCVIDTCAAGYVKVGNACERVVTLTLDANGGSTPAVTKVYMISRGEDAYEGFFKDAALTQHVTCDDLKSERTGYTFLAWGELMYVSAAGSCEFDTNEFFKNEDDMTISATWRANEYTVTFNANNGTGGPSTATVVYDATMTKLTSLPTRTGYQFAGYYDAATGGTMYYGTDGTAARKWDKAANTTLYAQWVVEGEYRIAYELNGGTNAETNPGTYTVETETITLADPTRTGYTFGGWYSESTFATLVTQIAKGSTGNKMLYAKWTPIKYTIKYNATVGTGTVADTNCTYDEDCTIAANGFTNGTQEFTGWTLNPSQPVVQFQPGKVVRNLAKRDGAVLTMYARWVACAACAAGAGANCELTAPVGVCKYATSCRTGYDTPVNAGKYNPSCSVITYKITYNLDGGTNPADAKTQYTVETADYTLPTPTWDGHTFIGWYSDAAFKNPITKIAHGSTGHVTLYAKWGTVSYNIVYNLNGGTNPADAKQSYTAESDDYTLPTPTKNGYNFAGWYTEAGFTNRVTKIASGSTGNKAFWAKWTTIPYTITYNLNGGTNPAGAKTQYTIESDDYTLPVPSKKGYDFGGWFTNDAFTGGAVTKIARGSTGAKTFWAKFTPMKIYCNPGKYLVAGATVCDTECPAGSMCAGGEVTYTGTEQGRSVCPAGTFSQAGANTCTKCLSGAFSATDGATACTPCAAGTTNDGWGNTKCDIQCANGAHVAKWMESTWNVGNGSMGQVVAGECEIESCATGYLLGDNECVERITCVPGKYYDGTRLVPCPAGSYCPGGGETTPGVPSCATSCATVGDGSYNVSVPGASSAAGCTHKCDAYPIVGGVAKPVLEYAPYPTQCEFTGVSDTGNPCDIIDGRCVETRCNGNYELINGRCEPCGRDFALSYNMTAGNCIVTKCEIGYHPVGDECAENTRECTIPGATSAVQEWNEKTNSFGACTVTECDDGYHIASNKCVSDTQACTVANGTGTQEWNHVSNTWGACVATECAAGYTNEKTESAEPTRECGPCRNGYGVDGTRVASSYIRGCEIASCMYQGEMYNLENNECVSICSVAGYSDETGTMKWNPVTKKCDRTCADGYRMW